MPSSNKLRNNNKSNNLVKSFKPKLNKKKIKFTYANTKSKKILNSIADTIYKGKKINLELLNTVDISTCDIYNMLELISQRERKLLQRERKLLQRQRKLLLI